MSAPARTRTVTWSDPRESIEQLAAMSGREQLEAALEGRLPPAPIARLLDIRGVDVGDGTATVAVEPQEFHANGTGAAHGGLAAALLDSAMWLALHSTMPAGAFCSTLQMNVHYVRPLVIGGGEVTCRGEVVHRGKRTGTAEGEIRDAADRVLARGSTTCLVVGAV